MRLTIKSDEILGIADNAEKVKMDIASYIHHLIEMDKFQSPSRPKEGVWRVHKSGMRWLGCMPTVPRIAVEHYREAISAYLMENLFNKESYSIDGLTSGILEVLANGISE